MRGSIPRLLTIINKKKEVKMTINFLAVAVILLCFAGVGFLSYRRGFEQGQREMGTFRDFIREEIKKGNLKVRELEWKDDKGDDVLI